MPWATQSSRAVPPKLLAIGLDPRFADFSAIPGLTPDVMRAHIDAEIARARHAGFKIAARLIAPDAADEAEIESDLRARRFGRVAIGAGSREPPKQLLVSVRILDLVHCIGSLLARAS